MMFTWIGLANFRQDELDGLGVAFKMFRIRKVTVERIGNHVLIRTSTIGFRAAVGHHGILEKRPCYSWKNISTVFTTKD